MPERHVVFVHGLFGPFAEPDMLHRLREVAQCSAPDLPGYGQEADADARTISTAGQIAALREHIESLAAGPVDLVAHSIGAVYAFGLADERPDLVRSLTSVEGNFTLRDAFWSRSIAEADEESARRQVQRRLDDPEDFLAGDGIAPTPVLLDRARAALAYQPWSTVRASAMAVVGTTSLPEYGAGQRRVFAALPVFLVAGERSAAGWDVPDWAASEAAGSVVMPGVGHMMMLEKPDDFAALLTRLHRW